MFTKWHCLQLKGSLWHAGKAREHDGYAVETCLKADNKFVGHVPMELSFLVFTFLRPVSNVVLLPC